MMAHHENRILVVSGPWGIGKSSAIKEFITQGFYAVVVKCRPASAKKGRSARDVVKHTAEILGDYMGYKPTLDNITSMSVLENAVSKMIERWPPYWEAKNVYFAKPPNLTIIYDEAQYLSRSAIDYLRYWNDVDQTITPFPVSLAFIGNPDFALDDSYGESVISGALESRADPAFKLNYGYVLDDDLKRFIHSRNIVDPKIVNSLIAYCSQHPKGRDLRQLDRKIFRILQRADGGEVTPEIVNSIIL